MIAERGLCISEIVQAGSHIDRASIESFEP